MIARAVLTLEEQLKALTALDPEYELLQRRRAQFQKQVREYNAKSDALWNGDEVEGVSHVSEWQDARNSRPEPM